MVLSACERGAGRDRAVRFARRWGVLRRSHMTPTGVSGTESEKKGLAQWLKSTPLRRCWFDSYDLGRRPSWSCAPKSAQA